MSLFLFHHPFNAHSCPAHFCEILAYYFSIILNAQSPKICTYYSTSIIGTSLLRIWSPKGRSSLKSHTHFCIVGVACKTRHAHPKNQHMKVCKTGITSQSAMLCATLLPATVASNNYCLVYGTLKILKLPQSPKICVTDP